MKIFSFPDHVLFWDLFAVMNGLAICVQKPVDAIYTTSPPHSTHLAGLALSKITGKPWIADFRDPWTVSAHREKGIAGDFLLNIERIMEKAILQNASAILANTKANRDNLLMAFPDINENNVVYMPNSWEEFPKNVHRASKSVKNRPLTIVHAGTFYPHYKPYALLYTLAAWRKKQCPASIPRLKNNLQIILLGASDSAGIKRLIHDLGIEEIVQVKPWVALDEARRIMCHADLLWASLGAGQESSTFIPSKLFEYIASKRPIIGFFPEGEAASLIRETGTGIVFTSDDEVPIIEFLYEMLSTKEIRLSSLYNPNNDAINSYNINTIASKLSQLLDEMIKKHREILN